MYDTCPPKLLRPSFVLHVQIPCCRSMHDSASASFSMPMPPSRTLQESRRYNYSYRPCLISLLQTRAICCTYTTAINLIHLQPAMPPGRVTLTVECARNLKDTKLFGAWVVYHRLGV
jgi:hypothetical protein